MSDDATLATLEQRTRTLLATQLRRITRTVSAHLGAAIAADPDAAGAQITTDPGVHAGLAAALDGARTATEATVRAGYRAAYQAGTAAATAQVADLGHTVERAGADDAYLAGLLTDLGAAFADARLDIADSVRTAHDGISGDDPGPARTLAVRAAVDRAVRRLGVRVTAAGVVGVHRGFTDAQSDTFTALAGDAPYLALSKRWEVRSANPCPACAALDGTQVGIDEQFDADATTDGSTPPRVYRDLTGPPRHPNCRCRIVLEPSLASAKLRTQIGRTHPGVPVHLSATEIRLMPTDRFTALTGFLGAALTRVRALLKEIDDGG